MAFSSFCQAELSHLWVLKCNSLLFGLHKNSQCNLAAAEREKFIRQRSQKLGGGGGVCVSVDTEGVDAFIKGAEQ